MMSEELRSEALEFMREHPTSHLATVEDGKPHVRVMQSPRIDEDFTVWYATSGSSNKIRQIEANPSVCTVFYEEASYARVMGEAAVMRDQETKDELWEDEWKRYWPNGKEDPDFVLIKIKAEAVYFLDLTKSEAMEQKIL